MSPAAGRLAPVDLEPGRASPWRATGRYLLIGLPVSVALVAIGAMLPAGPAGPGAIPRAMSTVALIAIAAFPFAAFASARPPEPGAWGTSWLRGSAVPLRLWGGALSAFSPPLMLWLLQRPLVGRMLERMGDSLADRSLLAVIVVIALALLLLAANGVRWPLTVVLWPPILAAVLTSAGWVMVKALSAGLDAQGGWFAYVTLLLVASFAMAALAARQLPLGRPPRDRRPPPQDVDGDGDGGGEAR